MRRKLSTVATAGSLLLCMAAVALWVRSYSAWDYAEFVGIDLYAVGHTMPGNVQGLISVNYGLVNYWGRMSNPPRIHAHHSVLPKSTDWQTLNLEGTRFDWRFGPFFLAPNTISGMDGRTIRGLYFAFPIWIVCLLTAALPARMLLRRSRRGDPVNVSCSECGYDLRATPDRCPECGATPSRHR